MSIFLKRRCPNSPINSGALFGLAAFAIFSTHDIFIKLLGASYSPFQILFFSALLSFPFITIVLMRDSEPGTLQPVHPWWVMLRSLSGVVSAVSVYYAFTHLPLSQVYAILFASPLVITVLAVPMLGETIRLRRGLAVLVGLIGVLVVLRPGSSALELGHFAALLGALTGALNSIIARKIGREERTLVLILYPMMTNLVLMAMILPFVYVPLPIEDLGLLAIVSGMVLAAMACLIVAYSRSDAMVVAPMQYSQIIWAALFGALLFQEYPSWQTYLGTGIIVLSGVYILKREATGNVSLNTPVLRTRNRIGHSSNLSVGSLLRRNKKTEQE
ncbi:DMT family transporter [Alphaproteobacteria bacterium]|nr:DMT family transporter [Alphaproteobacteria bacterium]